MSRFTPLAVFVTLDDTGRAHQIRRWNPTSPEDRQLDQHAQDLIGLRETIEPFTTSDRLPADATPIYHHLGKAHS